MYTKTERALSLTRSRVGQVDPFNLPSAPAMENPPETLAGIGHNMPPVSTPRHKFQVAAPSYEKPTGKAANFPEPTEFGTVNTKNLINAFDKAIQNHLNLFFALDISSIIQLLDLFQILYGKADCIDFCVSSQFRNQGLVFIC